MHNNHSIVFYDGLCGLCDTFISYLINADTKRTLRYSALSGQKAKEILPPSLLNSSTVVFYHSGNIYTKSEAIIQLFSQISSLKIVSRLLKLVPTTIRDYSYDSIARNRYKIFGKVDSCEAIPEEHNSLFIN